jgi:hypothetical protein
MGWEAAHPRGLAARLLVGGARVRPCHRVAHLQRGRARHPHQERQVDHGLSVWRLRAHRRRRARARGLCRGGRAWPGRHRARPVPAHRLRRRQPGPLGQGRLAPVQGLVSLAARTLLGRPQAEGQGALPREPGPVDHLAGPPPKRASEEEAHDHPTRRPCARTRQSRDSRTGTPDRPARQPAGQATGCSRRDDRSRSCGRMSRPAPSLRWRGSSASPRRRCASISPASIDAPAVRTRRRPRISSGRRRVPPAAGTGVGRVVGSASATADVPAIGGNPWGGPAARRPRPSPFRARLGSPNYAEGPR